MNNNKKIIYFLSLATLLILVVVITTGCGKQNSEDLQNTDDLSGNEQGLNTNNDLGDSNIPLDLDLAASSTPSSTDATTTTSTTISGLESQDVDLDQETKQLDQSLNSITGREFDGADMADKNFQ